jgi:hypothetical protein
MTILDYRTLTRAAELIPTPPSLLLDTVFATKVPFPTETFELHRLEGTRLLLPESDLYESAPNLSQPTREAIVATASTFRAREPILAGELFRRQFGTSPYVEGTAQAESGLEAEIRRRLTLLQNARRRREEYLAARAIQGSVQYRNVTVNFNVPAEHQFAGATGNSWRSGRNPFMDLRDWQMKVADATGVAANLAILGTTAAQLLLQHADYQKYLHTLHAQIGEIRPAIQGPARALGILWGMQLWEYGATYVDGGTATPFFPTDAVVVLAASPDFFEMWYAAVPIIDSTNPAAPQARLFQGEFLVQAYRHPDWSVQAYFIELISRPFPVVKFGRALFIATNLNA